MLTPPVCWRDLELCVALLLLLVVVLLVVVVVVCSGASVVWSVCVCFDASSTQC
jgi:hypothetical protein